MAWMQLLHHRAWHSLICSHIKDASANIKGMYNLLLRCYPAGMRGEGESAREWSFAPFEGSRNVSVIGARDCRVTLASAVSADAVRGGTYRMAHLSEVAFWGEGDLQAGERIIRSITSAIPLEPDTVVVLESTADGAEGYFHDEWERAVAGLSDKRAVFVPWYVSSECRRRVEDAERFVASLDPYERWLLSLDGVGPEGVAWYRAKRKEYSTHQGMMAEYPTTPEEAFAYGGGERVVLDPRDFL